MKVLFAVTEALPYFRTGGLAEVARSLPDALHARGIDVRIMLPAYPGVTVIGGLSAREPDVDVPWPGGALAAGCILHRPGPERAPAVLLEQPQFFNAARPYDQPGADALARRFGFFCRAVVAYAARWKADVVHLNDWPTGLVPLFALLDGGGAASVFAIHNLPYQGNFPRQVLPALGIPPEYFRAENGIEFYGGASFMKGGIALADRLVAVSPAYAREIQTPQFGAGMDGLLRFRHRVLHGILNGLNPEEWDPANDPHLAAPYDAGHLDGKDRNRAAIMAELGLDDGGPLLVMVTRLAYQKGIDLLLGALPQLLAGPVRIAVLGDQGPDYRDDLAAWEKRAPGRFAVRFAFDDRLARRLYAGGDFFLMPSRYEPCGLGQMIAQRYGTPPIVRRTGGLADTVEDGQTGFAFSDETVAALLEAVQRATACWRTSGWPELRARCLHADHSWSRSASSYEQVYRLATGHISA